MSARGPHWRNRLGRGALGRQPASPGCSHVRGRGARGVGETLWMPTRRPGYVIAPRRSPAQARV